MRQIRPGWMPSGPRGQWCAPARLDPSGRHPPPSNGRPLSSAGASHRAEVLMTRRHRGFTSFTGPVFPSLLSPDGTGILGHFLGLRTPQSPATHAEAGTVRAHWTGHYILDIRRTSFDKWRCTHATCVSHDLVEPGRADRGEVER